MIEQYFRQTTGLDHLDAHFHPDRGLYPVSSFHPDSGVSQGGGDSGLSQGGTDKWSLS